MWYSVTSKDFNSNYGGGFLKKHKLSPYQALKSVFPSYEWKPWLFHQVPRNFWENENNLREAMKDIANRLHVHHLDEWYRISRKELMKVDGVTIWNKYGNLGPALLKAFPDHCWDLSAFTSNNKKSRQRWLGAKLKELFPMVEVHEDFKHPQLKWDLNKNYLMEVDFWVPLFNLAFEYQGEQHYHDYCEAFGPSSTLHLYAFRDEKKKTECKKNGITLILVPYWWKGDKESLSATISKERPDVIDPSSVTGIEGISQDPPHFLDHKLSSDLSKNITNSMSLPREWTKEIDPTGWYFIYLTIF
eukprot:TRINITY_DN10759_c0_g1_i2.p1 TRINITY_DN10759_c0_g1~~TRINITY_DN10759_c0_g1_i2.p1  ORF type:complete len:347 (-),score=73.81 TRINITY_DN10759_c0_g1_i2:776-1681(-)